MFSVGDYICYPMHGVGRVDCVLEQTVLGRTEQYYRICFLNEKITAMLPISRATAVGLRAPATKDQCAAVIAYMRDGTVRREDTNWNRRYRDNMDLLAKGDIDSLAAVVKSLMRREGEKGISAGEKRMLVSAKKMLLTELSVVTGKEETLLQQEIAGLY